MLAARSGARKTGGVRRWQGAHASHGCLGVWRAVGPAEGHADEAPGAPFLRSSLQIYQLLQFRHTHFGHLNNLRWLLVRSLFPAETDDPTPFTALTPRGSTPSWRRWFMLSRGGGEHG